ncbi:MAG TPA: hypothetical protein VFC30_08375 [Solirubrobacteraceae bacterium]|nr:hypothetical protein [Solirubrobacteraceae bacterium]
MADGALDPAALLGELAACGVDFVLIGALAVGVHSEVRATGDVDVMLPTGDEANKLALPRALEQLRAVRLSAEQGGVDPVAGDPYPTVMFATRHGKLDISYRPDGSDSYQKVKRRSLDTTIGGRRVHVVGKDDLVRMKLAAGRTDDLRDVAGLTSPEQGAPRRVFISMTLAPSVEHEWARDLAAACTVYFDPSSRVRITDGRYLRVEARRSDLTDRQIEQWAHALADRLDAAGVIADAEIDVRIEDA